MSEHRSTLEWKRNTPDFRYETYDRTFDLGFGGGLKIQASSAPEYLGKAELPNPEEMLAASASSCHFLSFLALAAKHRLVVDEYRDDPVAVLEKNAEGKLAITRIYLRPRVKFEGEAPTREKILSLHEKAHEICFIASSLKSEIVLELQE
ncbi:MAG: OsmC family protein [Deltaproteobacteria bacterium]|nr:OsmC family protein [Deltaproteobacteria bacterium]